MTVCAHDPRCPGFGWAHDADLTPKQREELGLPAGELSLKRAKRAMRAHRKALRDADK